MGNVIECPVSKRRDESWTGQKRYKIKGVFIANPALAKKIVEDIDVANEEIGDQRIFFRHVKNGEYYEPMRITEKEKNKNKKEYIKRINEDNNGKALPEDKEHGHMFFKGQSYKAWPIYRRDYQTINEMKSVGLLKCQDRVSKSINSVKETLKKNLSLKDEDFVDFPVLFWAPENYPVVSCTSNVVNMLVITKNDGLKLIIPKPFGPLLEYNTKECEFQKHIKQTLGMIQEESGNKIEYAFVDVLWSYSKNLGEVHCATNTKRKLSDKLFWWENDI